MERIWNSAAVRVTLGERINVYVLKYKKAEEVAECRFA